MNFGNNFLGCLDYITGKYDADKHTKILAHSMGIPDMDNRSVAQVFETYALKGDHNIEKTVGHFAYSFHKNDARRITDDFMLKIVKEHMELMGIRDTEWILGRHYDTDHEHGHLMFSMVDNHGNVISDSLIYTRNKRISKYLTQKYGLTMSSDKNKVNRDKLRGKEAIKYDFYDKVMKCKLTSSSWKEFDKALNAIGIKLRCHYNNVTGRLMGVAFSDGKYSFSGKQLDAALKLDSLINEFGDLRHIAHEQARVLYEQQQDKYNFHTAYDSWTNQPDFKEVFPDDMVSNFKYMPIPVLLSQYDKEDQNVNSFEYTPSDDGQSAFISFGLLLALYLQPYQEHISMGGGGEDNGRGWRDDDDDKNKRNRNRSSIMNPRVSKPAYRPKR